MCVNWDQSRWDLYHRAVTLPDLMLKRGSGLHCLGFPWVDHINEAILEPAVLCRLRLRSRDHRQVAPGFVSPFSDSGRGHGHVHFTVFLGGFVPCEEFALPLPILSAFFPLGSRSLWLVRWKARRHKAAWTTYKLGTWQNVNHHNVNRHMITLPKYLQNMSRISRYQTSPLETGSHSCQ